MSDLMCDTQFYHAFCLSNIGRLYQTFISREENKSADWNNVILVKKFFDPETTLMANFCAVLCSDVGFQEVLQGLKSYTPEDAQILLSARRVRLLIHNFTIASLLFCKTETCILIL